MTLRALTLLAPFALMGCPQDDTDTWPEPEPDTSTDSDTEEDTEEDTDPGVDTEEPQTEHCGTLEGENIWAAADNPHVVTCSIDLEDAELLIEAGAEVYFLPNTRLGVSLGGFQSDFRVLGTEDEPVYFGPVSGPGPGKWGGVYIGEFAGDIRLENLTINGGGAGLDPSSVGNLWVVDVPIAVRNLTLQDAGGIGLNLVDDASLTQGSEGIIVTGSGSYGVAIDATQAHTLPTAGSDYSGNAVDAVFVDSDTITESVEWENLGVPYAIESLVLLEGIVPNPAILTIGPGVEVQAGVGAVLGVATEGGAAGLIADGTEEEPVRFTSLRAGVDAHWQGIVIGEAAVDNQVEFHHTTIEWGGGNPLTQTNLLVNSSPVLADHLTVQSSINYGIRMNGYDGFFRAGSNNITIQDTERPLELDASEAASVPVDTVFVDNRINEVELDGNRIFFDTTWPVLPVPWRLTGNTTIAAPAGTGATLTLPPGTDLRFAWLASMSVGGVVNQGSGNVYAVGTSADPIQITAADSYTRGAWRTIILSYCDEDETQFEFFELSYAETAFTFIPLNASANQTCFTPLMDEGIIRDVEDFAFSTDPEGFEFDPGPNMTYLLTPPAQEHP